MKPLQFASAAKVFLPLLCLVSLCLFSPPAVRGEGILPAAMQNYCAEPPFAAAGIKSNLLLMLDNSASMYDLAYLNPAALNNPSTYCLDDSYQDSKNYSGYFEPDTSYRYQTDRFVPVATLSSCSSSSCVSTGYLHLQMTTVAPVTVTVFEARGNFLNWLSMSKLDIQKKVLTGGKFLPDGGTAGKGVLQAESRGCQGKRFVKMINGVNVTFAVRGPSVEDVGFMMDLSRGGETLIEVFPGSYRKKECLEAVAAWRAGDRATLMAKANDCMDASRAEGSPPSAGWLFSRIMGHCYDFLESNKAVPFDQGLKDGCLERWKYLFGADFQVEQIRTVDGVCGRGQPHLSGDGDGFIGICYEEGSRGINYENECVQREMIDYCNEIRSPFLVEPASNFDLTGAKGNIANFILDAGIYHLGKSAGLFHARVEAISPVGLVQMFRNSINFGAMVFNANGAAGSECDAGLLCMNHCSNDPEMQCMSDYECPEGGTCAGSDGGRIISYINDSSSPPGDHASGLVHAIDEIRGGTYTPYAEAFYNAIGYYARRSDLRIAESDFDLNKPAPSQYSCQRNNILIISDGMSTADSNPKVEQLALLYSAGRGSATGRDTDKNTPPQQGSRSLDDLAWIAAHRNIGEFSTSAASTEAPATPARSVTTHVIFTGAPNGAPEEADPAILMRRTAESGGGVFVTASDPAALNGQLLMVLRQAAHGTGSGTTPSIHSGGGNGALFLQERYYPKKSFDGDSSASWIGEMQGLWYYIDPFIAGSSGGGSTIREDTVRDSRLKLSDDRVITFGAGTASAFYDRNGDGNMDRAAETLSPDAVAALWRTGRQLWSRNLATAPRRIFTPLLPDAVETGSTGLMTFSFDTPDHSAVLQPYLQASTAADAAKLVKYVHGFDFPGDTGMRSRTVRIGSIPASSYTDPLYVANPRDKGIGVWKLGDVISSAAKVQSPTALSGYDLPDPRGYGDSSYGSYLGSNQYGSRGMIYLGANDGMLHAFRMGKLRAGTGSETAVLEAGVVTPGDEAWAFIPRNVLPYLTYLKEPAYQHLYLVDGAITLADVSIGDTGSSGCVASSYWSCPKPASVQKTDRSHDLDPLKNTWRTVLIGSMGLGGASWDSCSKATDPAGTGAPCVPTPISDPADPSKRVGYSSYFALDVTDPANPSFLWEFSHPDLGYSTTGPAIVRVGDPKSNGRWFAVFGSGPTGPVREQQFLGESNRDLKFFVVDLRSGQLVTTIATGIPKAFAGSISGGVIDDRKTTISMLGGSEMKRASYQDDAIYVGYTAFDEGSKTWTGGGVGRIMIGDLPGTAQPDDSNVRNIWTWSRVIDGTGPVTTSIVRLQDNRSKSLWLYFGAGRYYYRSFQQDDFSGQRSIYGVKEPCYTSLGGYLDKSCSKSVCDGTTTDCLANQTTSVGTVDRGWRIDLHPAKDQLGAERVITDPVSVTGGAVFFPTFRPSASACSIGSSYLWGVRYDTGDAIPAGWLQGKVLMQLSTGELKETMLGELGGKRRIPAMPDSRPGGIKIVTNSGLRPLKKIIHMQER